MTIYTILWLVIVLTLVVAWFALTDVVMKKAHDYGRNKTTWGIWAFINSPLIVIVILHCAGKTREKRLQDIVEEQLLIDRMRVRERGDNCGR